MTDETPEPKRKRKVARRGRGEGSITQQKDGTWLAAISLGTTATGKRLRKFVRGATKDAVMESLRKLANGKVEGTLATSGKMTVGDLLDRWLKDSARLAVAPTTLNRYTGLAKKHIKPLIGHVHLSKLQPLHVETMISKMEELKAGQETRRYAFQVLRRALNVGKRWKLIAQNPCQDVDSPKVTRREISPLTVDLAKKLICMADDYRNGSIFTLAIATGLRRGELFALHWEDIDLESGTISVKRSLEELNGVLRLKEPKSKSGKRLLKLPAIAVESLWQQRAAQMAEGLAKCPFVFANRKGELLRKSNFERFTWKPCRKAAGIPDTVVFHDLRHTSASILLSSGTHPKIVQERLGHSKISLTMDTYSHMLPGMQDAAAVNMDSMLRSKIG